LSRDPTLQSAVSWLQNGRFRDGEEIAGVPSFIISSEWNDKAIEIYSLWITGQQDRALTEAELCLDSLPPWGVAQCAWLYSLSGEQSRAEELADMALQMTESPMELEKSALVFRTGGDLLKAVELCSRALAISPLYAEARLVLADSLWDLNRIEEAGGEYHWFIERGLSLPEYAMERLLLLEELGYGFTPAGGEGI
jgi:tetratricopeptide (TPR) repeat protein